MSFLRSMRVVTIIDAPYTMIYTRDDAFDPTDKLCRIGKLCWKYVSVANGTKSRLPHCCIGFCMDLLSQVEDDLQFTSDIYIVEDSAYGATVNGSWVGLVGDVVRGKADLIAAAPAISERRSKVVSFTDPFLIGGIAIVTLLEKSSIPFLNTEVFSPMSMVLWLTLFLVTILTSCLLVLAEKLVTYLKNWKIQRAYTIRQSLHYVAGLLFQRDIGGEPPISYSSRLLSIVVAIATMVVMTAYTAVLTANKVTYTNSLPITGYEDKKVIS